MNMPSREIIRLLKEQPEGTILVIQRKSVYRKIEGLRWLSIGQSEVGKVGCGTLGVYLASKSSVGGIWWLS